MKKFLGFFAIILAVVLSSFSISKRPQTQYPGLINGPIPIAFLR